MGLLDRVFRVWAFLLVASVLTLSACAPSPRRDPFGYAEEAFEATVTGTYLPASDPSGTPRAFAATVSVGAPFEGDPTLRDLSVIFVEPAALRGVTVTATVSRSESGALGRSVSFAYPSDHGTVELTAAGGELDGFLRMAEALLPIGDIVEVSAVDEAGGYTVIRRTGDGTREAELRFDRETPLPTRVILRDGRGTVDITPRRLSASEARDSAP